MNNTEIVSSLWRLRMSTYDSFTVVCHIQYQSGQPTLRSSRSDRRPRSPDLASHFYLVFATHSSKSQIEDSIRYIPRHMRALGQRHQSWTVTHMWFLLSEEARHTQLFCSMVATASHQIRRRIFRESSLRWPHTT